MRLLKSRTKATLEKITSVRAGGAMKDCTYYIEKALGGDSYALAEAFKLVEGMSRAYIYRQIHSKHTAEDILQDSYLIACEKLHNLRNPAAFPGWFRAILSTSMYRALRDKKRQPDQLSEMDVLPSLDPSPYELAVRYQTREIISQILASLKGRDKEACVQRYIHGRPYKEIAEGLGLPLGTLKRRLHEARETIIREYQKKQARIIRVGYLPISDHLLAMVAHARHAPTNCEVHLQRFLSWSALVKSLANGLLDAAFVMAPLGMSLHAQGMEIIYVLDGHHDGSALTIGSEDEGLQAGRMGLPYAISTHAAILESHLGLSENAKSNVRPEYINPSYIIRSLKTRKISAFFCSEPWSARSVADGSGQVIARSGEISPGHMCCGLTVRKSFALAHPELLKQYVASLLRARDTVHADPVACGRIQESYTGVPAAIASKVIEQGHITFNDLRPTKDRAQQAMNLALKAGILSHPCKLNQFLCSDFV